MFIGKKNLQMLISELGKILFLLSDMIVYEKNKNLYKGNLKVNRKQKNNLLILEKILNTKVKNSILWSFGWMDVFVKK